MADMIDYLLWRGDLTFAQAPLNPVDTLIFATLSYLRFAGIVPEAPGEDITLAAAADALLAAPDAGIRMRSDRDRELLETAAGTQRFGGVRLLFYRDVFITAEDTQFSAVTFLPGDGSAFLAFRGTDSTLVGWKEDCDMAFLESVPAQRLARAYTESCGAAMNLPLRLGGHSKGGNLAVYAAAKCDPAVQARITAVYNHDGPGFTEHMMTDPGYLRMVPKIHTYVPQSSFFGMLLEREEPHVIIKSHQVGLMQHDPYSWDVLGADFVPEEALTPDSRFLDRTLKTWLAGMTPEERGAFFDAVFGLLMTENASHPRDVLRLQNLRAYLKGLKEDDTRRRVILSELAELLQSARQAQHSDEP